MTMAPLSPGAEETLRFLWWRNPRGRLVDLGSFDQRKLVAPVRLGLVTVEISARGRSRARLTEAGRYYARLLAAVPPRAIKRPAAPVERLPLFAVRQAAR